MLKGKFTIIGLILFIGALYMQYGAAITASFKKAPAPPAPLVTSTPSPVAGGYVKSTTPQAAAPSSNLRPFDENEYQKLYSDVSGIDVRKFGVVKVPNDYKYSTINVFVPKITSSAEEGMKDAAAREKLFSLVLHSADINYVGYYDTPSGITAIVKVRSSGISVLKIGETVPNSNMMLKALNERYIILENLVDHSTARVYISSR